MESNKYDFMIVGLGLAGTLLTDHLLNFNKSVIVFDNPNRPSSSRAAAGLFNPITGRKMVKTWNADALFQYLSKYYQEKQQLIKKQFYFPQTIYRPFLSIEEQNEWFGKSSSSSYVDYIEKVHTASAYGHVNDAFGGIALRQSGWISVAIFLDEMKALFSRHENVTIQSEDIDVNNICIGNDIQYNGFTADNIIFCDGNASLQHYLFDWIPLRPVKGEVLNMDLNVTCKDIINRGIFVIPLVNGRYKVGATYNNRDHSLLPTDEAKTELEEKLNKLININGKVIEHQVGIRPATKDRKPMLGMHPKYKNVGIFNGLGAKGVSLGPYYSNQLANFLVNKMDLDAEVNVSRFYKEYLV